jgi:3-oxoacyl-[acyl-carrier-protein] synthase-3
VEGTIKLMQSPAVTNQIFCDNFASLTVGDGAVGKLLCHKDFPKSGHLIDGSVNLSATEHNHLCVANHQYMKTDSYALLAAGAELVFKTWRLASETFEKWGDEYTTLYVPHQVSTKQIFAFTGFMGVDIQKVYLTLSTLRNMASAALPLSLALAVEEARMGSGDQVVLVRIGGGINCSLMRLAW